MRRTQIMALVCFACFACSACSHSGSAQKTAPGAARSTTSSGKSGGPAANVDPNANPPSTRKSAAHIVLSPQQVTQAVSAVRTNWDKCLAAVDASSATAKVEAIDDSSTGRPVDKGNLPVLVHIKWGAKTATFLVDLRGRLTGAALYGPVAAQMLAAAKEAGGDC